MYKKLMMKLAEKVERCASDYLYNNKVLIDSDPFWTSGKGRGELIPQEKHIYKTFKFKCNKPVEVKINGYEIYLHDGEFECTSYDAPVYSFKVLTPHTNYKWKGTV